MVCVPDLKKAEYGARLRVPPVWIMTQLRLLKEGTGLVIIDKVTVE